MPHSRTLTTLLAALEQHPFPTVDLKLERVQQFLTRINLELEHLPPVIHVAGTNGKGSVLAFLHAMIEAAGMTAHRYTSPHLVSFHERFILANRQADDAQLVEALEPLMAELEAFPLTFFESATVLAFRLFTMHPADLTLLEVGLGGRLDATNIVPNPLATIIMPIALDHQHFLGDTIAAIAYEKACIIKPGVPCIIGHQPPEALEVIADYAARQHAPLYQLGQQWEYHVAADGSLQCRHRYRLY
jgi:dihydrofolate synthase / folylpolyglutamate synthase